MRRSCEDHAKMDRSDLSAAEATLEKNGTSRGVSLGGQTQRISCGPPQQIWRGILECFNQQARQRVMIDLPPPDVMLVLEGQSAQTLFLISLLRSLVGKQ